MIVLVREQPRPSRSAACGRPRRRRSGGVLVIALRMVGLTLLAVAQMVALFLVALGRGFVLVVALCQGEERQRRTLAVAREIRRPVTGPGRRPPRLSHAQRVANGKKAARSRKRVKGRFA